MIYKIGYIVPNLVHCIHGQVEKSANRVLCVHKGVGVRSLWQPMGTPLEEEARTVPGQEMPCPVQVLRHRRNSETD